MKTTTVKVDSSTYKVELHDLSVLFLYSSKHPLILPIFLYMLAMTDKKRRGQLARVLGRHPMNSEVIAELFGVGQSTVRTAIKLMIESDLVRYNTTTVQRKEGPPVTRRTYTVMLHKLTKRSVDLSKDIARANKDAVKARRLGIDPAAALQLIDHAFVWVPQVGRHDEDASNACVSTRTQAISHPLRPYTDALYLKCYTNQNSRGKLVLSVYSGVTPENTQVFQSGSPPPTTAPSAQADADLRTNECHIDVTPAGDTAQNQGAPEYRVTPSLNAEPASDSASDTASISGSGLNGEISPIKSLTHPAIATLAKHAGNGPLDAIQGHVLDEGGAAELPLSPPSPERPIKRILDEHRATGIPVDPLRFAYEASAAANESELAEADMIIRGWGIPQPYERLLHEFCKITRVYPARSNKGKASRTAWVAAMERITTDRESDSFVEACYVAVEKAKNSRWTISGPFSVKVDANAIAGMKRRGDWPGLETYIRRAFNKEGGDERTESPATDREVIRDSDKVGEVVWTITKEQQHKIMNARLVKDRARLWREYLPDADIVIRGDENAPVSEYNFVGPRTGRVKVEG